MSRFWALVSIPVFVVSVFACNATHESTRDGQLELVVRPKDTAASGRPLQGRFVLHAGDGGVVDWIEVANAFQTSRVTLPEGLYLFEWQPARPLESAQQAAAHSRETSGGALPIPIAAGRVTTVNASATLLPRIDDEPAAPAEEMPSVEILITRR